MKHLRIKFSGGTETDHESECVPRIGEQIVLSFGADGAPAADHFFRVRDVVHRFGTSSGHEIAVLVDEENEASLAGVR